MHFKIISEKDKQLFKNLAKHKKKICLGFGILLFIILLVDASPFGANNVQLYTKWVQCGRRPYVGQSFYVTTKVDYYTVSGPFIGSKSLLNSIEFFCTPHEAELAGYSANLNKPDFPHLTPEEKADIWRRRQQR